jgi:hypothetical protein
MRVGLLMPAAWKTPITGTKATMRATAGARMRCRECDE